VKSIFIEAVCHVCTMITVDKEELRVDRAVKVSRKELNLLVAELLDCADILSSDDEDIRTQQQECPLPPKQVEPLLAEVCLKHDCNFLLFVCSKCVISLVKVTWFQDFASHLVFQK
jgi:hypothetical protein